MPHEHGIALHEGCGGPSKLILPSEMNHNEFIMKSDILQPMETFFLESSVNVEIATSKVVPVKFKWTVPPPTTKALASQKDLETL